MMREGGLSREVCGAGGEGQMDGRRSEWLED